MRFTQFGHQVPRRNSRMSVACSSNPARVNVPSRLAAPREKSGARDPISRVSVRFCILSSTLSEAEIGNNNGWGTGDGLILRLIVGLPLRSTLNSDGFYRVLKNADFEVQ